MDQPSTKISEGPSPDIWELHRSTIKRLYLNEDKTLPQIKQIMEHEFKFKATSKMYKRRFTLWKIDGKNLKKAEIKEIARRKVERDAVGKSSSFSKKGREVNMADVRQYLRKHGFSSLDQFNRAASPGEYTGDIVCLTPSRSPAPPGIDKYMFDVQDLGQDDGICMPQYGHTSAALCVTGRDPMSTERPSSPANCLALSSITRSRWLLSLSPVPRILTLPKALSLPEDILLTLSSYLMGSLEMGVWETDRNGNLVSMKASNSESHVALTSYAVMSIAYFREKKYVQLRQVMAEMCAKIQLGIKFEFPELLPELFYAYHTLYKAGLSEPVSVLVHHAYNAATEILGIFHPVAKVCGMLRELDASQQEIQSWLLRCQSDTFEKELGPWHDETVWVRNLFFYTLDPGEVVDRARALITAWDATGSGSEWIWFETNNALAEALIRDKRYAEAEQTCRKVLEVLDGEKEPHLKQTSRATFLEKLSYLLVVTDNNIIEAERYAEQAVEEAAAAWGWRDSSTMDFMSRRAMLLRKLGRHEKADEIDAQIQDILGPPEIKELLE
jgi:tetratricopeptide (TPR) repeat protein